MSGHEITGDDVTAVLIDLGLIDLDDDMDTGAWSSVDDDRADTLAMLRTDADRGRLIGHAASWLVIG